MIRVIRKKSNRSLTVPAEDARGYTKSSWVMSSGDLSPNASNGEAAARIHDSDDWEWKTLQIAISLDRTIGLLNDGGIDCSDRVHCEEARSPRKTTRVRLLNGLLSWSDHFTVDYEQSVPRTRCLPPNGKPVQKRKYCRDRQCDEVGSTHAAE